MIHIVKVETMNRNQIPTADETIENDIDLDAIVPNITEVKAYFRSPEKCPYKRGNWIIDIILFGSQLNCMKLPKEMSKEEVLRWLEPLHVKLRAHNLKGKH